MDSLPPMRERICLVTGATSGIGKMTALGLAQQGAIVVLVGRDREKCELTLREIKLQTGNEAVDYFVADMSSQQQVRKLVEEYKHRYHKLHVLINNAGVLMFRRELSCDGIELTLATNYFGPFLLTNLLLDTLKASAPARIINVTSVAHKFIKFDLTKLQTVRGSLAYPASKFAIILFTYELARRLETCGVAVNAVHPGVVATNLGWNSGFPGQMVMSAVNWLGRAVSPEEGAETVIYLATSPDGGAVSGKYFVRNRAVPSAKPTYDEAKAKRLWEMSVALTGIKSLLP